MTDVQTSDGEMYYGVFSDDESSESNEVDYETDLEVDEESKLNSVKTIGIAKYEKVKFH